MSEQIHISIEAEIKVRALRDAIFGASTDANWKACRVNWMRPDSVRWLVRHQWGS